MTPVFCRSSKFPIYSALLGVAIIVPAASAQDYRGQAVPGARSDAYVAQNPAQAPQQKPQYEVAERSAPASADRARQILSQRSPDEHPLMPCLRWAYDGIDDLERIQDYQARMVKRERIDGKLGDYESMYVKIRH
ncbi:MAG: DUF1571 domain-containing protein, partial [Thermoguttaceae bacterium]